MDKGKFIDSLLNGQTKEQYLALLIFAFIGLFISMFVELLRARKRIEAKGGFSLAIWFGDNWLRCMLSILVIAVGVLYAPEIGETVGMTLELSNKGALVTGFFTDKIVEALIDLKPQVIITKLFKKSE